MPTATVVSAWELSDGAAVADEADDCLHACSEATNKAMYKKYLLMLVFLQRYDILPVYQNALPEKNIWTAFFFMCRSEDG